MVGPGQVLMEGIVGEGVMISVADAKAVRPSTIAFDLAKRILYKYFKDEDGEPKLHLFGQVKRVARRWLDEGYLQCKGDTGSWMLEYLSIGDQAAERIYNAIVNSIGDQQKVKAVLDPYNPKGSTAHVGFRSPRGAQFRRWATTVLSEFLVKGFAMNDERLKEPGGVDYFDELLERIRDIRASEKRFYQHPAVRQGKQFRACQE
jgi:hypothetical protein